MTADVVATWDASRGQQRDALVVVEPLAGHLAAHGIGGVFEVEPIGLGLSNATFELVFADGRRLVLRRPPRGPLPPSAHDVVREARVLSALATSAVPVPRVLVSCEDPAVIGAPFYVMEHIDGEAPVLGLPAALETPSERRRFGEALVDVIAAIHAVDLDAAGLRVGRDSGHLERQLELHLALWEHSRTRELSDVERLAAWLRDALPAAGDVTLVHGDFHPGNVMLDRRAPARIVAVLDWELATRGDPLADLGYLCALWREAGDPPDHPLERAPVTRGDGSLTRDQIRTRYAARTGRDVSALDWYEVLALWRAVIFMEGNFRRAVESGSGPEFLAAFGGNASRLAAAAWERATIYEEER